MTQEILEKLHKAAPLAEIKTDEPMSNHTTFKAGGKADFFVSVTCIEEAVSIIRLLHDNSEPYFIIGNGSNVLVRDSGFKGTIIELSHGPSDIRVKDDTIEAQCGAYLSGIANAALKNSLTGFEFASGIPGTLGGALYMNAGAYGGEMKDVIKSVTLYDINKGETVKYGCRDMKFGYRHSILKEKPMLVMNVSIKLNFGSYDIIKGTMDELREKRISKQPLEYPSAGSAFKRPEGHFAGKLIEDAGLKGYAIGDAAVSEKHCGFVINKGNASADDIITLINDVIRIVKQTSGVLLEPEVIIL